MPPETLVVLIAAAAILTAVVGGVFLAFSDFVMKSLSVAPSETGVQTMQLINRRVYKSVFLVLLLGMAPISALIAAFAVPTLPAQATLWLTGGAALYFGGVIAVTMICNVPMNNRLDSMENGLAETNKFWAIYLSRWTWWNHLRTAASLGAAACFTVAAVTV